jgi:hypothetical protein
MRKMMILIIFLLSIFTILSSFVSTTYATPLINDIGLPNAPVIITFDELVFPEGTAITNQYASFGVSFSPGVYYNSQGPVTGIPGISGNYVGNFNAIVPPSDPFSIYFTFSIPQAEAAFGLATNPGTTTLTAYLYGSFVESFDVYTTYNNPATAFVGFTGILFNEIAISTTDDYWGMHYALVDTIQDCTVPVPEPATIFLLGSGLLGVGWLMRKRRA